MALRPDTCATCRRPVLWVAKQGGHGLVALDTCAQNAGDVAIQTGLLGVEPHAVYVPPGTSSYREHLCPKAHQRSALSHTAAAPAKKRRP